MAVDLTSMSLLSTCRRAAANALKALAGTILEPERRHHSASFANVHHDDILRMPQSAISSIALAHGGRVALVHRPGTSIVELMSEDTYNRLYRRGIDD